MDEPENARQVMEPKDGGLPPRSSRKPADGGPTDLDSGPKRAPRWPKAIIISVVILAAVALGGYYGLPSLLAPRVQLKVDQSPSAVEEREKQVAQVKDKIEAAKKSVSADPKAAVKVEVTNDEVNAYLAKAVDKVAKEGSVYPTAAQVSIKPEAVAGDVSLVIAGKPVGLHLDLKPEVGQEKVVLKVVDAAIGGIPLPTSLGPLAGAVRQSLPSGVTFDSAQKSFVIDPAKFPFTLEQLRLEAGKITATVGDKN